MKQELASCLSAVSRYPTGCLAPPGTTETAQQSGHITGAKGILWCTAIDSDGTFKSADKLQIIYPGERAVDPNKDTITDLLHY